MSNVSADMANRQPFFYDVTLRDGNQALPKPWNNAQKKDVYLQLLKLGVQGAEVGFPASSEMDFESCKELAQLTAKMAEEGDEVAKRVVVSGLARCVESDIQRCWEAVQFAPHPRIHTFLATSPLSMEHVLHLTPEQVKEKAVHCVKFAKSLVGDKGDVEFSAEHFGDCLENMDFVIDVLKAVVEAGATTINLPNTVERYRPFLYVNQIKQVYEALPKDVTISVHCHNDLGMATANTVSGIINGARQAEVTINGIGERAGNTSLEEVVMTFRSHKELGIETNINTTKISGISRMVSSLMNMPVQPNKAIVGRNAFAHSSGIHQDGVLKNRESYEIIDPKDVGIDENSIVLTARSGRAALKHRLHVLGIDLDKESLDKAYEEFLKLADRKKEINDDDVLMLAGEHHRAKHRIKLDFLQVTAGVGVHSVASVGLDISGEKFEACASGNGPVDAAICAIKNIIRRKMLVKEFLIQAINKGSNDVGKVHMTVEYDNNSYYGFSANTDIVAASAEAFIDAINKFVH